MARASLRVISAVLVLFLQPQVLPPPLSVCLVRRESSALLEPQPAHLVGEGGTGINPASRRAQAAKQANSATARVLQCVLRAQLAHSTEAQVQLRVRIVSNARSAGTVAWDSATARRVRLEHLRTYLGHHSAGCVGRVPLQHLPVRDFVHRALPVRSVLPQAHPLLPSACNVAPARTVL